MTCASMCRPCVTAIPSPPGASRLFQEERRSSSARPCSMAWSPTESRRSDAGRRSGARRVPRLVDVMDTRFGSHSIWHEWDALDVRFAGDSSPGGSIKPGRHVASMRVWVRTEAALPDDLRIHQAALAYLSDLTLLSVSTVPHPVVFMSNQLQTASIDHAVWFHRRFRPSAQPHRRFGRAVGCGRVHADRRTSRRWCCALCRTNS